MDRCHNLLRRKRGSRHVSSRAAAGFTLLELIVVLAIMGLVVGFAIPALTSSSGTELRASARTLAAALRRTRNHAVSTNSAAALSVDVDKHQFAVAGERRTRTLPTSVKLKLFTARSELDSEARGRIRFFPDGSSTGGRVTLSGKGGIYSVDIDWLTGRIQLLTGEQESLPGTVGVESR